MSEANIPDFEPGTIRATKTRLVEAEKVRTICNNHLRLISEKLLKACAHEKLLALNIGESIIEGTAEVVLEKNPGLWEDRSNLAH